MFKRKNVKYLDTIIFLKKKQFPTKTARISAKEGWSKFKLEDKLRE